MLVQMNVEDTRLGVAEYVIGELGVECVELKWGQGAKCIGGEIQVDSLERALELQKRAPSASEARSRSTRWSGLSSCKREVTS